MAQRILIVRLSAVGDTILNLPLLCALRHRFPDAELGWVVARGAAPLLEGHACLDRLFVLKPDDQRSIGAYWRFIQTIRNWGPETVLDAQGLTKSAGIGWLSGAKKRIGLARSEFEGRELSTWINNCIITPNAHHVIDRGLALLQAFGIHDPAIEYHVPSDSAIQMRVSEQISSLKLGPTWAILNVGAGWESKVWPNERYAAVARHLLNRWGISSVVAWGGAKERAAAEAVVAKAAGAAHLAPSTTLPELAEWIRCSSLFVGSDTGPLHLAVAVGTPTIGMIGPMPIERVGPRGPQHIAIQNAKLSASDRSHRKTDCGPMLSIDVPGVLKACDTLLARRIDLAIDAA